MQVTLLLLGIAAFAGTVHSYLYCNLYNGQGCKSSTGFTFLKSGTTATPNSLCNKNYQVSVKLPRYASGFFCYFYMDVPEQSRYVYSMSQSTSSSTSASTFLYGYGKDARINVKNSGSPGSTYYSNHMNWKNVHAHPDDNHYSWIRWNLDDYKMSMRSSSDDYMTMAHPQFMAPTKSIYSSGSTIRMGLNRHNNYNSYGSGLCRAYCNFVYASPRRFVATVGNNKLAKPGVRDADGAENGNSNSNSDSGPNGPPAGEPDVNPNAEAAPTIEDLNKLLGVEA